VDGFLVSGYTALVTRKHLIAVGVVGLLVAALGWWRFGSREDSTAPQTQDERTTREAPASRPQAERGGERGDQRGFDVLLDDDPDGALRLEGQVVDAAMQPVRGAIVTLDSNPPRHTTTEEDGGFYFDKLVGRPYQLVARAEDSFAGPVTVSLTDSNDPVILTLREAARVEVTVRSASGGDVVGGARVELRDIDVASSVSDARGIATVRGVAPGMYRVMAVADGYAPDHSILRVPNDTKVAEHEVVLRRGAPVGGRVQTGEGKPVVGARVTYDGASSWAQSGDARYDAAMTDAAGRFRFDALPQGSFRFVARADGFAPGTSDIVTLDGQSEPALVVVTVPAGATLAGTVVDAQGKPAASARVRVQVKSDGMRWGRARQVYSNDQGRFEMKNLPAKVVEAMALHDRGSSENLEVELTATAPAEVTLQLSNTGVIAGVVVDEAGEPVEGAQVSGWPSFGGRRGQRGPGRFGGSEELTDAGGRFVLRGLAEGTYSLRATPPGSSGMGRLWFRDSVDAEVGDQNVRLVLPADGAVTGKVEFANGEAPEAFAVGFGFGAPTPFVSRDGSFTLTDLPPRNYSFVIRGIGFDDKRIGEVSVEAGKTKDLGTITVSRGRRIAGRVVDASGSPVQGALIRAGRTLFGDGSSSKAQFGPPWARNAKETRSGDDGAFVISGLGAGTMSVVAEHEDKGRSVIVSVGPRDDATNLNLALQRFGALEGSVTKGGQPAADIMIQASMVDSPQVSYVVQSGEDGRFRFDRLAPGAYKASAMAGGRGMRGFGFFRKDVHVNSDQVSKVELSLDAGEATLVVTLKPSNRDEVGFGRVYAVLGKLSARTARELELAVASSASTVALQAFAMRGNPAELRGLASGDYSVCAYVLPTEVSGMGTTMAYIEREGDELPVFCKQVTVGAEQEQQLVIEVAVPDYVPDTDT